MQLTSPLGRGGRQGPSLPLPPTPGRDGKVTAFMLALAWPHGHSQWETALLVLPILLAQFLAISQKSKYFQIHKISSDFPGGFALRSDVRCVDQALLLLVFFIPYPEPPNMSAQGTGKEQQKMKVPRCLYPWEEAATFSWREVSSRSSSHCTAKHLLTRSSSSSAPGLPYRKSTVSSQRGQQLTPCTSPGRPSRGGRVGCDCFMDKIARKERE